MELWGEKMEYCFSRLKDRVFSAIDNTDLDLLFSVLKTIDSPTIVTGVGGSSVVSAYFEKVLEKKNGIICTEMMPRDLLYRPLDGYNNVVACSYSGKNIGVTASFNNDLNKYLFSGNKIEGTTALRYTVLDQEESFVSLAGTLIPMSLLFLYYTDNDRELLKSILSMEQDFSCLPESTVIEVIYGRKQSVAARFLESTITEGALGAPVLHEKYNYCHGRCQLNFNQHNDLIYFSEENGLDELFKTEFPNFYRQITEIVSVFDDPVVNDFYLTYQAMLLCKKIAEKKGKDISIKVIPEISDKIYYYKGDM
ncbi:MAG: hypothetical protein IJ091_02700 [Oscillospiraceae bacterium]|nr:hypothetical protein [Oscillospiraceae bacterium]